MMRSLGPVLVLILGLFSPENVHGQKNVPAMAPLTLGVTPFPTAAEFAGEDTTAPTPSGTPGAGGLGAVVAGAANQLGALSGTTNNPSEPVGGKPAMGAATANATAGAGTVSPVGGTGTTGGATLPNMAFGATTTLPTGGAATTSPAGGAATTTPVGGFGGAAATAPVGGFGGAGTNASSITFAPGTGMANKPGTESPTAEPTEPTGAGHTGPGRPADDNPTEEAEVERPTLPSPTDDQPTDDEGPTSEFGDFGGGDGWDMPEDKPKEPAVYVPPKDEDDPFASKPDESEWAGGTGTAAGGTGDWPQETPEQMLHDKNVLIAVGSILGVAFLLLLITAQQTIENPDGCCASFCRCWVNLFCIFFKIVCWPCRLCCGNKDRRTHDLMMGDSNSYTHDLELT